MPELPDGGWLLDDSDTDIFYGMESGLQERLMKNEEEHEQFVKNMIKKRKERNAKRTKSDF